MQSFSPWTLTIFNCNAAPLTGSVSCSKSWSITCVITFLSPHCFASPLHCTFEAIHKLMSHTGKWKTITLMRCNVYSTFLKILSGPHCYNWQKIRPNIWTIISPGMISLTETNGCTNSTATSAQSKSCPIIAGTSAIYPEALTTPYIQIQRVFLFRMYI